MPLLLTLAKVTKLKTTVFFILFCCASLQIKAQLIFDNYNTDKGLSNNNCRNIVQDEDGFIWIATASGLNRFDGKDFVKYYSSGSANQLPSNDINKIIRLSKHRLGVATSNGLAIFNTKTAEVRQLLIPAAGQLKAATNTIRDVIEDTKENIIVCSNGGVYVFDSALKIIFRYDAYTLKDIGKKRLLFGGALHLLPGGRVLMIGNFHLIYLLNIEKKVLENINDIPGNEFNLFKPWNGHESFVMGSNKIGQFFFIRYYQPLDSLFIIDLPHQKSTAFALPFSVEGKIHWTSRIIPVNDSLLAVTLNYQNGIYFIKFNNSNLQSKPANAILPGNFFTDIVIDGERRMWACSDGGIFKQSFSKASFNNIFPPVAHKTFPPLDKDNYYADKAITGIIHYQKKYFVSQYLRGVSVYDDSLHFMHNASFEKTGKRNLPLDINYYSKDTLLIAVAYGALLMNTVNYTVKNFWQPGMPTVLDSSSLVCSFIDSRQQLWMGIGGGNGVFRMNLKTYKWKYFSPEVPNAIFKLRYPVSIAEDSKGHIWMSGAEGITRWDYQKQLFDTLITKLPGIGDITGCWSYFTIDKRNNFWAIEKGPVLVKWNLITQQVTSFPLPGMPPLSSDFIQGPWNNRLWIQTDKGILSFNIKTEKFTLIKKSDGLYNDNISERFYFDSSSNRLFAGFNNNFTWFHPQDVLKERRPVQTIITGIKNAVDSLSTEAGSSILFSYKNNSFSVEFTGINYDDGENNSYAYRLFEHKPGAFINIGTQKTVSFASLKPGHYIFQVKTILPDGTESISPTSLYINISWPFYETWWFYLLCVTAVAAVLYSLYRYRINQLLKLQQMRNRIAGDLHDDIGSSLSSISIMSELAKGKSPEASSLLDSIGENAAVIQENMSDIVWAINPKNDRFENVLQRMTQFASEILDAKNIELNFITDDSLASSKLSMGQRKSLYFFFKEAINNAAKYSGAQTVCVKIFQQNNHIEMDISDNGKGFDRSKISGGNGMDTLKKRASELGGSVSINSAVNEGVKIVLKFKIT